jgi:hypothetical protein
MSGFNGDFIFATGPQKLDLAIHTLEGLIRGITIDSEINEQELEMLNDWISDHILLKKRHPFNELIPKLSQVIEDRSIDEQEISNIMGLCKRFKTDNIYYNKITSDLQRLRGILIGIVADGMINKEELVNLQEWLGEHQSLKTCWPYDEVFSLVMGVLKDGKIDPNEHKILLELFDEFIANSEYQLVSGSSKKDTL